MDKYLFRRILTVVVLFILIIFVFTWLIRKINTKPTTPSGASKVVLNDIVKSPKQVKFVTQGRIVGNEAHREIRITITRSSRVLEIVEGYENTIIARSIFPNNEDAFKTFLSALASAGFISSKQNRSNQVPQGICPTGQRYWYQIIDGTTFEQSLWSNSCNAIGTFNGKKSTVSWLFQNQIPDYSILSRDVKL